VSRACWFASMLILEKIYCRRAAHASSAQTRLLNKRSSSSEPCGARAAGAKQPFTAHNPHGDSPNAVPCRAPPYKKPCLMRSAWALPSAARDYVPEAHCSSQDHMRLATEKWAFIAGREVEVGFDIAPPVMLLSPEFGVLHDAAYLAPQWTPPSHWYQASPQSGLACGLAGVTCSWRAFGRQTPPPGNKVNMSQVGPSPCKHLIRNGCPPGCHQAPGLHGPVPPRGGRPPQRLP
jgi:hypothetical protein